MDLLDIATIVFIGLMIGNEVTVSLFINPAIWQLNDQPMASLLARLLGKVMPFWYALCLVLLAAETYLRWPEPGRDALLVATAIWLLTIVFTVAVLVPRNNRVGAAEGAGTAGAESEWRVIHKRWDTLHRWRIGFLLAAFVCLLLGLHV